MEKNRVGIHQRLPSMTIIYTEAKGDHEINYYQCQNWQKLIVAWHQRGEFGEVAGCANP